MQRSLLRRRWPPPAHACVILSLSIQVYVLCYSIIMLNTDLHNPKIHPKITTPEFTTSCQRTALGAHPSAEAELQLIYDSIAASSLAIAPGQHSVSTIVRFRLRVTYVKRPIAADAAAAARSAACAGAQAITAIGKASRPPATSSSTRRLTRGSSPGTARSVPSDEPLRSALSACACGRDGGVGLTFAGLLRCASPASAAVLRGVNS